MKGNAWLVFLATATLEFGVLLVAGWVIWIDFTPQERAVMASLWISHAGMPILTLLFLLLAIGLGVNLIFRWYITPLRGTAEQVRTIAMTNPNHRLTADGRPELQELIKSINLLAERYQARTEDVQTRIREANATLEEEKTTLAALMAKLTQGVLVCNHEGRIILYNQSAQRLLENSRGSKGSADWIGLGRSVYGLLDENLIRHALAHIHHRLDQNGAGLMVPFLATRYDGQLLRVHLVPVLDKVSALTGYILTLEDITRLTETESRRGVLLQSLSQGQRGSIANIRAAIETVLEYPDMDDGRRQQFQTVIRDEALKLSRHLDQLEAEYAQDLNFQWPLEQMLGSDLLAAIEHHLNEDLGIAVEMSAPLEPLWLKVDSYSVVQSLKFVITELRQHYQAIKPTLKLERQRLFACMELCWEGAMLDMETLRGWGKQVVMTDKSGASLTLHDVIKRHGGAVWSHTQDAASPRYLRLLLPVAEDDKGQFSEHPDDPIQDYDFRLFSHSVPLAEQETLPLIDLSYTVLDTETTGLDPAGGDEIIALGAVRVVKGRILQREIFDSFVKPRRAISLASTAIHGIAPAMLRGESPLEEVLPRFHRFVEDTVLIGHNVAFDMRFLELSGARTGLTFMQPVLDTLLLSYAVNPHQEAQSLEEIAKRLGIVVSGRHTALGDALITAQVFVALIPLLAERNIYTFSQARAACENTVYAQIKY
jgi:DNA polymerase-3 subunit epsilon